MLRFLARRRLLPVATLLLVLAARPAHATWPNTHLVNSPISAAPGDQFVPVAVADGNGGSYVAWLDTRNQGATGVDVYATHLDRQGNPLAGWSANGLVVCNAPGDASALQGVSDGNGGVIWCWQDARGASAKIYVARMNANGSSPAGWPANGLLVSVLANACTAPSLCGNGTGGAWVGYQYAYSVTDNDLYVAYVPSNGSLGPLGTAPIATLSSAVEETPALTTDGGTGCYLAYQVKPSGGTYDIYAAHVTYPLSVTTNRLTFRSSDQTLPIVRYDGFQGFFAAWTGVEPGKGTDTWAARVMPNLTLDPSWFFGSGYYEIYASTSANDFSAPQDLLSDDAGGMYVGFRQASTAVFGSSQVGVLHIGPHGALAPGWPGGGRLYSDGVIITAFANNIRLASDGSGGVIAAFEVEPEASGFDVGAQHLLANGNSASGWPDASTYLDVGAATYAQVQPALCVDGSGGAYLFYNNRPNNTDTDIYGQRLDRFGYFGLPAPKITAVRDVPGDQGGHVRVSWNASYLDGSPYNVVGQYRVWRQAPAALAQAALRSGAARLESGAADGVASARPERVFRVTRDAAQTYYWELLATQAAAGYPGYSLVATTTGDSTGAGNPRTAFMVDANNYGSQFWSSDPDSGYSVDNLPPVAPAPFTGNYVAGHGTILQWLPNAEADLADYELFRGGNAAFPADNAHLVTRTTQASFDDAGTGPAWYKLRACDVHGNCSALVTLLPGGTTAVGDDAPATLAFALGSGNPSRGVATLHLALPRASAVAIDILDAQGRRVRALAAGVRPAGTYAIHWDGADEGGHATASGLYFARLTAGGETRVERIVRID